MEKATFNVMANAAAVPVKDEAEKPADANGNGNGRSHSPPATVEGTRLLSSMLAGPSLEPKNLRVLVCDSDNDSSNEMCNILQDCSYNVVSVKTSKQALEQLEKDEGRFDMILKEHDPPKSDACRMLRKIWKHKTYRNIPVVITSNRYESSVIQNCLQHGAADYMLKPLRHNEARTLWIRVWNRLVALKGSAFVGAKQQLPAGQGVGDAVGREANASPPQEGKDDGSGMSTQSDADMDGDSHEGSNPNDESDGKKRNDNGGPQGRVSDEQAEQDRVGPTVLNGLGKPSAFQAFSSPWNRKGSRQNDDSKEGNGYSNGKNAASNVVGPQHGNGSGGNGSGGNGSGGSGGNGSGGNGTNGASSRRIIPKVQPAQQQQQQQQHPAPHQFFQQDSNMTLTPFGPMPSHLAQSVLWGMAAQQEMNFIFAATAAAQQQQEPTKKRKAEREEDMETAEGGQHNTSGRTNSTQTGANGNASEQTSAERRAAALDKYRQKRKTLCFSKKIRYASRKQLAEARPRIKGQFVKTNSDANTNISGGKDNNNNNSS